MNLKVKYLTLGKLCIFLMLIIHARCFYLFSFTYSRTLLMSYCAIISVLCCGLYLKIKNNKECKVIVLFCCILVASLLYSLIRYNITIENVSDMYTDVMEYFTILAAVSVYLISKEENGVEWIEKAIICIGTSVATILTLQCLVLAPMGIAIFDIQYSMRLGGIRFVNSTEPILFGAIFALSRILNKNKKNIWKFVLYWYALLIATTELVFVAKTRALLIVYFITIIIMLWNARVVSNKKEIIRKTTVIILICVGVIWVFNTDIAKAYFNEYTTSLNTQYDTMSIRREEAQYALKLLLEDPVSTFIGTGFAPDDIITLNLTDNSLKELRTDIGILGFVNQFGIVGLFWISAVFIMITKLLYENHKYNICRIDCVGLYSLFLLSLPTLFLFNGERLAYFPIWLGIMMFYSSENKQLRFYRQYFGS